MKHTILSSAGAALLFLSPTFANAPSSSTSVAPSVENTSCCGFRSGFRAGIGLGYKNHSVQNKYEYVASAPAVGFFPGAGETRNKISVGQSAFYQVHAAYDWIKNNWLLSIELDYRYNPTVNKGKINSNDRALRTEPGDFVFKQSHRHDFGLGFRAGQIITSRFSVYGIVNVRLGQFDYRFISEKNFALPDGIRSGRHAQFRLGGGLGIGCQYVLAKRITIGPEITYDIYQPIKINQNLGLEETGAFSVKSSRPKILNAMIKLSKTF